MTANVRPSAPPNARRLLARNVILDETAYVGLCVSIDECCGGVVFSGERAGGVDAVRGR